ncbi:hypothetical protein CCMA1212_002664 [Trichoderma ghanense]|uniref:Uncharacterized protein n=1 Tax=Trichoderma ghanense TaxID=65468 RepID=A0ABY2HAN6_9HYPO
MTGSAAASDMDGMRLGAAADCGVRGMCGKGLVENIPGSVCQPLQMQAAIEVAVVAVVRSGVSGGILSEPEADPKSANAPAAEPMHVSNPMSVLALEETRSPSGLTFSDGVGQPRLSRSCGIFTKSFWPTSRCSSSTARDDAFMISESFPPCRCFGQAWKLTQSRPQVFQLALLRASLRSLVQDDAVPPRVSTDATLWPDPVTACFAPAALFTRQPRLLPSTLTSGGGCVAAHHDD